MATDILDRIRSEIEAPRRLSGSALMAVRTVLRDAASEICTLRAALDRADFDRHVAGEHMRLWQGIAERCADDVHSLQMSLGIPVSTPTTKD